MIVALLRYGILAAMDSEDRGGFPFATLFVNSLDYFCYCF